MVETSETLPPKAAAHYVIAARVAVVLTAVVPLVLIPRFFFPFVTTRNVFFRLCVEIGVAAVVLAGVKRLRDIRDTGDPILKWFLVYVAAISVAAIFGLSRWHSLFGDFERMGGVWASFHLLLFYLLLRTLLRGGEWIALFRLVIGVADTVVVWGSAEFLPSAIRNSRFQMTLTAGSTIGNPGLLAPYLLLSLAVCGLLLVRQEARWWRAFSAASFIILLFGIAGARNRSSELGLLVGTLVAAGVLFWFHADRRRLIRYYLVGASILVTGAVGGSYLVDRSAPSVAEHFAGRWKGFLTSPIDYSRTIEWNIAIAGFRDRPILGYGPENHQIISSRHFDPRIYSVLGQAGGVFDRTHNAWLELLATSGAVGAIAMIGIWVAAIWTLRAGARERRITTGEAAILSGALAGYAVYLTFWFFDINSVVVWVTLLAFLGYRVFGTIDVFSPASAPGESSNSDRVFKWGILALILLAGYFHGVIPLVAAHDLNIAGDAGRFETRIAAFHRVITSGAPQTEHTLPLYYQFLRTANAMNATGATELFQKEFDVALRLGMAEADRSISRSPQDDRSYVDAARMALLAGAFYKDRRYVVVARDELRHAVKISARRPDARILLSTVELALGDSAAAGAQLDTAMRVAPQYGAAFFIAARQAVARNNVDSAAALLTTSLQLDFHGNEDVYAEAISKLDRRGQTLRAARLGQVFLQKVYGPFNGWGRDRDWKTRKLSPFAYSLANKLPILYLRGGDPVLAVKSAFGFAAAYREAAPAAYAFASDIRSGRSAHWKDSTALLPAAPPVAPAKRVPRGSAR